MFGENEQLENNLQPKEIGARLREGREALQLSASHIAERTRIPSSYIACLENGEFESLPGIGYIPGFIRSYCKIIAIDPDPLIASYRQQLSDKQTKPEYKFPVQALVPKMAGSMVAMVVVLACLSGYIGWVLVSDSKDSQLNIITASTSFDDGEDAQSLMIEQDTTIEQAQIDPIDNENLEEVSEIGSSETLPETLLDTSLANRRESTPISESETLETASHRSRVAAQATQRQPFHELVITAKSASWVEIIRADGEIIVSKLIRDGDKLVTATDENLFLSTGNAGGLIFNVADIEQFQAGKIGEILRDFPLDLDTLKQRQASISNAH